MFNYNSYLKAMYELDEETRNTRFFQACVGGEIDKVNLLLDNKDLKVDMYSKDTQGNDAFRWACIFKHEKIIDELLFKYEYKISKRNLNYITKRNNHFNGELEFVLRKIEILKESKYLEKHIPYNKKNFKIKKL